METVEPIENKLIYRIYQPGDEEGILRLWKEESGWGELTKEQFKLWFLNTPYGDCLIVVAADESNEVKGQIIYAPSRVIVEGRVIKALRGAAPILDSSLRGANLRSLRHPAFGLIQKGFEVAAQKGHQFVYTFPAYGWMGIMQMIHRYMPNPSESTSYDCFAIPLVEKYTPSLRHQNFIVAPFEEFTEEHDTLWLKAVAEMPVSCAVQRESKWLNHICGNNINLEVRVYDSNALLGYISIKKDGLMTDLVAANLPDLKTVFEQALYSFCTSNSEKLAVPFNKLKGMITKETETVLRDIVFEKDEYRFAFGGYLLDTSLDFEKMKTENWYMSPLG